MQRKIMLAQTSTHFIASFSVLVNRGIILLPYFLCRRSTKSGYCSA